MAALEKSALVAGDPIFGSLEGPVLDAVLGAIKSAACAWEAAHANDVIVSRRILFFTLTIRWRDVNAVAALFGQGCP